MPITQDRLYSLILAAEAFEKRYVKLRKIAIKLKHDINSGENPERSANLFLSGYDLIEEIDDTHIKNLTKERTHYDLTSRRNGKRNQITKPEILESENPRAKQRLILPPVSPDEIDKDMQRRMEEFFRNKREKEKEKIYSPRDE